MKKKLLFLLLAAALLAAAFTLGVAADPHEHVEDDPVTENVVINGCNSTMQYDLVIYCTTCGEELYRETIITDPPGHNFETIIQEPTCTEGGYRIRCCTRCGEEDPEGYAYIPPRVHEPDEKIENETPPGCTEGGQYDIVDYCVFCGEELSRQTRYTNALGHDWNDGIVAKQATCEENGRILYTCTRCGEHETVKTDALGHDWDEGVVTKAPWCEDTGSILYTCTRCGFAETIEIDALGHDYTAVVSEPNCIDDGLTTYTCNRCGFSCVDNFTDALGHDWGEWMITKEVTTEDGEETRVCRRDPSHVETRVIPAPTEVMTKPDGPTEDEPEKSNAGVYVAVAVAVVAVVGGGAAVGILFYLKKKKAT